MATQGTFWDDPYYRWQQQLVNGMNIGNSGWQTALGLMLGTGLGSWLGHQYGNWLQKRDENFQNKNQNQTPPQNSFSQNYIRNLIPQNFDLGWTPPQNPYEFPTAQQYWDDAIGYKPDWRQRTANNLSNANMNPPQNQTPSQYLTPMNEFNLGYTPPPPQEPDFSNSPNHAKLFGRYNPDWRQQNTYGRTFF